MQVYAYPLSPTEERMLDSDSIAPATTLIAKIKAIDAGCDAVDIGGRIIKIKKAEHAEIRAAYMRHLENMQIARSEAKMAAKNAEMLTGKNFSAEE